MIKKILLIAVAVAALAILFLLPTKVKVKIECISQYGDCPPEILSSIQKFSGKSIGSAKKGIKTELGKSLMVSDFSTQFKLPDILLTNIIIKKPEFALQDKNSGKIYLMDAEGNTLTSASATSLPMVIQDGTTPNLFAQKLIAGVYEMYQVNTGRIENGSLLVDMPAQIRVIFPISGEDPQVLLGGLRLIYSKVTSGWENGKYSEIDLRFRNPVLR